jgi:hypothetical protein
MKNALTHYIKEVKVYAEKLTGDYQSGFRRDRPATRTIFYMWQTMAKHWEYNIPLLCKFTDSQTAYTTIITTILWLAISMMGFPKNIKKAGQISNTGIGNFIHSNINKASSSSLLFSSNNGLKNGDVLATPLYNIAIDRTLQ